MHPVSAKCAICLVLLLAFGSAWAGTVLEAPEVTSHRTRQMLDIKGIRWAVPGRRFSGMVEAHNQSSRDARLHVVGDRGSTYRKSVVVPAGQTVRFPVYFPVFESGRHSWRECVVEFRQDGDSAGYHWERFHPGSDSYHHHSRDLPLLRPRQVADLPEDPRLYWSFTTLSLTPEQWTGLDAGRRQAILDWLEIGGHLHLRSDEAPSSEATVAAIIGASCRIGRWQSVGKITDGLEEPENGTSPPYLGQHTGGLNPSWRVARISPLLLVPLVVLFALAIGPGTIWYCHRRNRPAWALMVIPAVSLISCLAMLAFSLFHDGVTPKICRQTITLLDQRDGSALTAQLLGFEAPLGLWQPVILPEEALVMLPHGESISPRTEARGGELHVRGAVLPRTPAFFAVLHRDRRRERLEVRHENDTIRVVNGLGAPIVWLFLRDRDQKLWHNVATIPPGGEASLQPGTYADKPAFPQLPVFALGMVRDVGNLAPGSYLISLEERAFGVPGIPGGRAVGDNFNLVAGRYE